MDGASSTARVVFVCGNSRSGTTVMARILGRLPEIVTFEELHYFERVYDPSRPPRGLEPEEAVARAAKLLAIVSGGHRRPADPARFLDEARQAIGDTECDDVECYTRTIAYLLDRDEAELACDQTPRNVYYLPELLDLLPDAVAVVVVRDPRDVLLSQKHRWDRQRRGIGHMSRLESLRLWAGYHPSTSIRLWRSGVLAGQRVADHPRATIVRFEDLVATPEAVLQRVCERIGVDFDPNMSQVEQKGSSHRRAVRGGVGLDASAAQRWRQGGLDPAELEIVDGVAGELMGELGYERAGVHAGSFQRARVASTLGLKVLLASVLNAKRVGNPVRALRRRFR